MYYVMNVLTNKGKLRFSIKCVQGCIHHGRYLSFFLLLVPFKNKNKIAVY